MSSFGNTLRAFNPETRYPGASIGPAESENINSVGTLSGLLQHTKSDGTIEYFAYTNCHVVDPYNTLENRIGIPYVNLPERRGSKPTRIVECPQHHDWVWTKTNLQSDVEEMEETAGSALEMSGGNRELLDLKAILKQMLDYKIELGPCIATSGHGRKLHNTEFKADWALIKVQPGSVVNQVCYFHETFQSL